MEERVKEFFNRSIKPFGVEKAREIIQKDNSPEDFKNLIIKEFEAQFGEKF